MKLTTLLVVLALLAPQWPVARTHRSAAAAPTVALVHATSCPSTGQYVQDWHCTVPATTAGNLALAITYVRTGGQTLTVTGGSETYAEVSGYPENPFGGMHSGTVSVQWAKIGSSATSIHFVVSGYGYGVCYVEFSASAGWPTNPVDKTGGPNGQDSVTSWNSGNTATLSQNAELLIGHAEEGADAHALTFTSGTNWTTACNSYDPYLGVG